MSNKHKTTIEPKGLKQTPEAYNLKGFYLECQSCGKKVIGQTEDEVMHNFRVHMMVHEKDEVKV